jgi:uncharacterized protein (TIGR02284 family)
VAVENSGIDIERGGKVDMTNDEVISCLNDLIETCKDRENGFSTASEAVENSELKGLFLGYSREGAQQCNELKAEVRRLGGDPDKRGTVAGALHRGWMNLKSAVTGGDEKAILTECERGEDSSKEAYEEAMKESLPSDVKAIVGRQYSQITAAHDRIRSLQLARKAAK